MILKVLNNGVLTSYELALLDDLDEKIDNPTVAGTEGQTLMLNSSLQPVWGTVQDEVYIGSDTPSGYNIYINPDGDLTRGEGVEF